MIEDSSRRGTCSTKVQRYEVPDRALRDLAAYHPDEQLLAMLRSCQLTKHKLLLAHVVRATRHQDECRQATDVLQEADRQAPAELNDLLMSPFIGAWGAACAQQLSPGGQCPSPEQASTTLPWIAAVAAARSGIDARLSLPARAGLVSLPTLGVLSVPDTPAGTVTATITAGTMKLTTGTGTVVVEGSGCDEPSWQPVRRLSAEAGGRRLSVALEDVDPYRDCYRKSLSGRVGADEFESWARGFQDAWRLLVDCAPHRAAELSSGLRALVPLSVSDNQPGLSATSRTAFGALALTLPVAPEHLAVTLVHEFQHSKLSALLDIVPLYDPDAADVYFAPWRPDPRPIGGLLQGVYAFLAVSDVWRRLRNQSTVTTDATRHFAELREQVANGLDTLTLSPHLTTDGREIVRQLRKFHQQLMDEDLPESAVRAAVASLQALRADWSERREDSNSRRHSTV